MAKQRGIHQISGKINNLCYYEQKYVRGGLIRRINEAMSERLKTDPVFANTRKANKIFGGCSMVATALLSFFGSRNTFLFKPYRHAILTRALRKHMLSDTSLNEYPSIGSRGSLSEFLPTMIDSVAKNSIFDDFPELERYHYNVSINELKQFIFYRDRLTEFCSKNHCIGVQLSISKPSYIYPTNYQTDEETYRVGEYNAGGRGLYIDWYLENVDEGVTLSANTGETDDATTFWIIFAQPIVSRNGNRPVLGRTGASCGLIIFYAN